MIQLAIAPTLPYEVHGLTVAGGLIRRPRSFSVCWAPNPMLLLPRSNRYSILQGFSVCQNISYTCICTCICMHVFLYIHIYRCRACGKSLSYMFFNRHVCTNIHRRPICISIQKKMKKVLGCGSPCRADGSTQQLKTRVCIHTHMSYSLNSLKGGYIGDYI